MKPSSIVLAAIAGTAVCLAAGWKAHENVLEIRHVAWLGRLLIG
ncbi:hypothetical protein [Streptomyces sp. NPDC096324]